MKFLLDTDCCIYLLTGMKPELTARVNACDEGDLGVSSITFAEIALGSENGKLPPMRVLNSFIEEMPVIEFDLAAARAYAMLPFKRGSFDRLIAAHALSRGLGIVTNNLSHFTDVPGLKVENWTA
jgi:tRNA(fMet)-specific endonuclease VapC